MQTATPKPFSEAIKLPRNQFMPIAKAIYAERNRCSSVNSVIGVVNPTLTIFREWCQLMRCVKSTANCIAPADLYEKYWNATGNLISGGLATTVPLNAGVRITSTTSTTSSTTTADAATWMQSVMRAGRGDDVCYDDYNCDQSDMALARYIALGQFACGVCLLGLLLTLITLPTLNLTNCRSAASVYMTGMAVADALYLIFFTFIVVLTYNYSAVFSHQLYMYAKYTARLIPYGLPAMQFCELFAVWITLALLIDRYLYLKFGFHSKLICSLKFSVKTTVFIIFCLGVYTIPKFLQYELVNLSDCGIVDLIQTWQIPANNDAMQTHKNLSALTRDAEKSLRKFIKLTYIALPSSTIEQRATVKELSQIYRNSCDLVKVANTDVASKMSFKNLMNHWLKVPLEMFLPYLAIGIFTAMNLMTYLDRYRATKDPNCNSAATLSSTSFDNADEDDDKNELDDDKDNDEDDDDDDTEDYRGYDKQDQDSRVIHDDPDESSKKNLSGADKKMPTFTQTNTTRTDQFSSKTESKNQQSSTSEQQNGGELEILPARITPQKQLNSPTEIQAMEAAAELEKLGVRPAIVQLQHQKKSLNEVELPRSNHNKDVNNSSLTVIFAANKKHGKTSDKKTSSHRQRSSSKNKHSLLLNYRILDQPIKCSSSITSPVVQNQMRNPSSNNSSNHQSPAAEAAAVTDSFEVSLQQNSNSNFQPINITEKSGEAPQMHPPQLPVDMITSCLQTIERRELDRVVLTIVLGLSVLIIKVPKFILHVLITERYVVPTVSLKAKFIIGQHFLDLFWAVFKPIVYLCCAQHLRDAIIDMFYVWVSPIIPRGRSPHKDLYTQVSISTACKSQILLNTSYNPLSNVRPQNSKKNVKNDFSNSFNTADQFESKL